MNSMMSNLFRFNEAWELYDVRRGSENFTRSLEDLVLCLHTIRPLKKATWHQSAFKAHEDGKKRRRDSTGSGLRRGVDLSSKPLPSAAPPRRLCEEERLSFTCAVKRPWLGFLSIHADPAAFVWRVLTFSPSNVTDGVNNQIKKVTGSNLRCEDYIDLIAVIGSSNEHGGGEIWAAIPIWKRPTVT